jgi:L-fuconolactonase
MVYPPDPATPAIDAHHHFWRYRPEEYGWIDDSMAAIRRDFLPDELKNEIRIAGIDGVISVQARQSVEETRWLLELAGAHGFVRGVVGWAPLTDPAAPRLLEEWRAAHPKLRGVRHVLQGEPDERYMLGDDFNRGIAALARLGLAYDLLVYERQLPAVIEFVDRHPRQVFVLDHIGKPRIREHALEPWRSRLRELARRPNVFCKLSGLTTEAAPGWTEAQLHAFFEMVLEIFGPTRLMFGSDWPVCVPTCSYARWMNLTRGWTQYLTKDEQRWIYGGAAVSAYGL